MEGRQGPAVDVEFVRAAAVLTQACFAEVRGRHEVTGTLRVRLGGRPAGVMYLAACRLRAEFPGLTVELG
ncbi:hypothetical protein Dvina_30020 [Dactylosporangium vinaceum]|uniref:Uncharacterized protein n=1 Tax=Dactylosporangium vinaceum TaxID=53362 RepID=A0ABV5LZA5_9ACTN|nr:hypothetical protein [Dactylosporangium vinaceum]UAB92576.1 hypothetical protein Dvina_30020 [Dactylosporangium vinaceum]